ncbi:lactonase family protein [Terriglobus saanensis]|uniref:Lactonase, 7-bladed beta propeller n=1 Tax=Terriglobus saanensis (strain ATCC BAA-1853 / DSM 23119 / SP1PR4) TaxID=401053 RepID=E8V419_TERSS|nr:beta-propeller fold lactonase family protein [Terriglobus saanensis]ADV82510.1 hypothetical protein AciPR4_1703 [Terriglobus saanensis SP1PR4]
MSESSLQSKTFPMTRRAFSTSLAAAATLGASGKASATMTRRSVPGRFAYIGSGEAEAGAIHVVDLSKDGSRVVQTMASASPAHLELHPSGSMLYAVHAVNEWESLPRGAVSAYAIDAETGHLTLQRVQPLALSAINPSHALVTPDGSHLIVAVAGGGSYNVLPLESNGLPLPVSGLFKEVGFSTEAGVGKTSTPSSLVLHSDGRTLVAADTGNESLSTFRLETDTLTPLHRRRVHKGAGPSQMVGHTNARFVYALNSEDGSISVHRIDTSRGQTQASHQRVATNGASTIAMHPSGRFLLTANGARMTAWKIDRSNGRIQPAESLPVEATQIAFDRSGRTIIAAHAPTGRMVRGEFSIANGSISGLTEVGNFSSAHSFAIL